MILDGFLESGMNRIEYLDSISVSKQNVKAHWIQIGFNWRHSGQVQGYEIIPGQLVDVSYREVLLSLYNMIKVVNNKVEVDKEKFMKYHKVFTEMMNTARPFNCVEDLGWRDEKEIIVYGNQPSKDYMLKGKKIHTTCEHLAERFNEGKTEIKSLKYYVTENQRYFTLYIKKNNLDEPYELGQGLPRGYPTVIFLDEDTEYLQHQLTYFQENRQKLYIVKIGGNLIEQTK